MSVTLATAGTHRSKGGVTRRVDESDLCAVWRDDLIGADMLGDTARLAGNDIGMTNRVK